MSTKLHVGNIPLGTADQELRNMFGRFGLVEAVSIIRDTSTGRGKGYAVVTMTDPGEAQNAIRGLNFSQFSGRTIGVGRVREGQS